MSSDEASYPTSHADFLKRSYYGSLDGVRCLAILGVVWHHSVGLDPFSSPLFSRGYLGVDLFFVLSGFLITTILVREDQRTGRISLKNFYARRSLRIFPVYYTFLFLLTVWIWKTNRDALAEYLQALPYYLAYLTNWIPPGQRPFFDRGWSLAVEEQFYVFWPPILVLFGIARGGRIALGIVIGLVLLNCGFLGESLRLSLPSFLPFRTILMGSLLAMLLSYRKGYELFCRAFGNPFAIVGVSVVLLGLLLIPGKILGLHEVAVHLTMVAFVGSAAINETNALRWFFTFPAVKQIGVVSYGIYLYHGQLFGITQSILGRLPIGQGTETRFAFFIVFTLISTFVSVISYYFFEIYFLRLKSRFVSKPASEEPVAGAANVETA